MTAGQRAIAQPSLSGGVAAVALAATFAIGLVTGLVVPRVQLPASAPAVASSGNQGASAAAYRAYRDGERTLPVVASRVGDPAWGAYREGERLSVATPALVGGSTAWQLYRQGERASLVGGSTAWQLYRQGERTSLVGTATATSPDRAWLDYRAGERGDTGR